MSNKKNKKNKMPINVYSLLLFMVLAFNINFFYLFPSNTPLLGELDWILSFLLFVLIFIKYRPNLFNSKYRYFWLIEIAAFVLMINSSCRAHVNYHQPLWYGIRAQRENIIFPFLFLDYFILLDKHKISKNQIYVALFSFACIEMCLGYLQVSLLANYQILYIGGGTRYGFKRLWMNTSIITLVNFLSLNELLHGRHRILNGIIFIACILFVPVVTRWRLPTLALFGATFLVIVIFSKISALFKLIVCVISLVAGLVFLNATSMGSDLLSVLNSSGQTDTSLIRVQGRQIFLNSIIDNPLFGGGFVNIDWQESYVKSGYVNGIYVADNGIFGFIYYYGLIGLLYVLLLHIFLFSAAHKRILHTQSIDLLGVVLNSVLGSFTVMGLGMDNYLVLAIIGIVFTEVAQFYHLKKPNIVSSKVVSCS